MVFLSPCGLRVVSDMKRNSSTTCSPRDSEKASRKTHWGSRLRQRRLDDDLSGYLVEMVASCNPRRKTKT
jgi:hypothetical protein